MWRRVVLLCGPPGSGKSTHARSLGLTVYDRDDPQWVSEKQFGQAIGQLARDPNAQAVVIRAGATKRARATAARLIAATETTVLAVDIATCRARVVARKQPSQALRAQIAGIDYWWRNYQPGEVTAADARPEAAPRNPRYANGHRRRQLRKRILAGEDMCALCGQPVDKTLHHLDPGSAVIDEDLPVSRGGNPLSRANTNLMHRVCNSRKGTRTLAEAEAELLGSSGSIQSTPIITSRAW